MPSRPDIAAALADAEIGELQSLLDALPVPLEPLDASALDGYLAAVVLQQPAPPPAQWLRFVTDVDGRALPHDFDAARLHELARRRHAELEAAVARRQWFDPWVFELDADDPPSHALIGWVAGFATAMEHFPALLERAGAAAQGPLALLYRHLDPDDLEQPGQLLAEIDALEPPADLGDAVEDLVCATLLLADLSRPLPGSRSGARRPAARRGERSRER